MSNLSFCKILLFFALFAHQVEAQDVSSAKALGQRTTITTADFSRVKSTVDELAKSYSSDAVLVVVDIDNTLLAMNQDLGSDQWFNWQDGLLRNDPKSKHLVADDFPGLLEVQGELFAMSKMHPPEPDLPELMIQIQATGVTTVILTSRGYSNRDAAERELARNGYDIAANALQIEEKRGLFMPFDPCEPEKHGLNKKIVDKIKARLSPVTYSNGIYMTAGQHKGYMLRTLLARAKTTPDFKAIVFVDDHKRHTERMHEAYKCKKDIHLVTFEYTREAGNVRNFENSSKRHVVEDWKLFQGFSNRVLVK